MNMNYVKKKCFRFHLFRCAGVGSQIVNSSMGPISLARSVEVPPSLATQCGDTNMGCAREERNHEMGPP